MPLPDLNESVNERDEDTNESSDLLNSNDAQNDTNEQSDDGNWSQNESLNFNRTELSNGNNEQSDEGNSSDNESFHSHGAPSDIDEQSNDEHLSQNESSTLNETELSNDTNGQSIDENSLIYQETSIESNVSTSIDAATDNRSDSVQMPIAQDINVSMNVKNPFAPHEIDETDADAISDVFNLDKIGDNTIDSASIEVAQNGSTEQLSAVKAMLDANESAVMNENGQIEVKRTVDPDIELSYIWGENPVPKEPVFEVKINDIISGNIPFKENVSFYLQFSCHFDHS